MRPTYKHVHPNKEWKALARWKKKLSTLSKQQLVWAEQLPRWAAILGWSFLSSLEKPVLPSHICHWGSFWSGHHFLMADNNPQPLGSQLDTTISFQIPAKIQFKYILPQNPLCSPSQSNWPFSEPSITVIYGTISCNISPALLKAPGELPSFFVLLPTM